MATTPQPPDQRDPADVTEVEVLKAAAETPRPTVLIADASRGMRRSLVRLLADDHLIVEADTAEAAWHRLVRDARIHAALFDLEAAFGAFGLLERIRDAQDSGLAGLPVILISGPDISEDHKLEALARGATEFLGAPFSSAELRARIGAAVKLGQSLGRGEPSAQPVGLDLATDPLPSVRSQAYFRERIAQEIAFSRRHQSDFAVVRLALHDFRNLGDDLGEEVIAVLLRRVGTYLRRAVRREDTVTHFGRGQFGLLMPATGESEARSMSAHLLAGISRLKFRKGGQRLVLSASAGLISPVAGFDQGEEALLGLANRRLEQALLAGPARVVASEGLRLQTAPPRRDLAANLGLDRAVELIAGAEVERVEEHIEPLLARLLPLLELANRRLDLGLAEAIETLRERLRS